MEKIKRQWLCRILTGALAGVAAHVLLGYVLGSFSLFGPARFTGFVFPYCGFPREIEWLGVLLSFALFALFGAEVGIATIPFADSGRELVVRSLIHYTVTAATVCLWAELNVCSTPADYLTFLVPLALVQHWPLQYLFDRGPAWYGLLPIASLLFLIPCFLLWRLGVRHYCSTGS